MRLDFECLNGYTIECTDGESTIRISSKCRGISTLREGGRTGIEDDRFVVLGISSLEFHEVGMTIHEDVASWTFRHFLFVIHVSMGDEEAFALINDQTVSGLDGELQQHLVYLRIAIATNGYNVVYTLVEEVYHALGIEPHAQSVTGTIVENITHQHQQVIAVAVIIVEYGLQSRKGTVYVG